MSIPVLDILKISQKKVNMGKLGDSQVNPEFDINSFEDLKKFVKVKNKRNAQSKHDSYIERWCQEFKIYQKLKDANFTNISKIFMKHFEVNIFSNLSKIHISSEKYKQYTGIVLHGQVINMTALLQDSGDYWEQLGPYIDKIESESRNHATTPTPGPPGLAKSPSKAQARQP
jgi:hypothetical protein